MKLNKILLLLLCMSVSGCSGQPDVTWDQIAGGTKDEQYMESESGAAFSEELPVQEETVPALIYVDVEGAVNLPGVVTIPYGARVYQAVEEAGGFSEEAAVEYVNQAAVLSDGQQIRIYTREEAEKLENPLDVKLQETEADRTAGQEKVNLNTATEEELMTLPGIGEAKAADIVSYREENGGFQSIEEIKNISGIKDAVFSKIRDRITVAQ